MLQLQVWARVSPMQARCHGVLFLRPHGASDRNVSSAFKKP